MKTLFLALSVVWIGAASGIAADNVLPVREVTVFKDGHAVLLRQGEVETNDDGNVLLTSLPRPVMGTYWPFADDGDATLSSVSTGTRQIDVTNPARSYADYLRVNVGRDVSLMWNDDRIEGRIVELSGGSELVLLETELGFQLLPISQVKDLRFDAKPVTHHVASQQERTLEMQLDWNGEPQETATVGMMYLQKGIRWIPGYRIELGDNATAIVSLQATLINDLIDLENANVQLVVGVPSFKFKSTLDPIGGTSENSDAAPQLSAYFQSGSQSAHAMSNALVTQVARMSDFRGAPAGNLPPQAPADPLDPGAGNPGEMHIFKLENMTLRRGDRQVRTIAQWEVPYEEVYKLEIDSFPSADFHQYLNRHNQNELTALMASPKVRKFVRLENTTDAPLTTAPALLVDGNERRVLAQSMMTYAAIGSRVDLELTTAVDIQVIHDDRETGRTPNALTHNGNHFARVDLTSTVSLANYRSEPLIVEVERRVFGGVDRASGEGDISTPLYHEQMRNRPYWYVMYSWPYWWSHLNAARVIRWSVEIPPAESATVSVDWHYFWR